MRKFLAFFWVLLTLPGMLSGDASASERKLIALTFDDGPSRYTEALLDGLSERGAFATFFMTGVNGMSGAENHPELLERMWQEGHQLANHTYSHTVLTRASGGELWSELSRMETLIFRASGGSFRVMLRPPEGAADGRVRSFAHGPVALWSVDPLDWKNHDADRVCREILENASDGAIVLLHDLYEASVRGALMAADELQREGYELVTVAELLRRKGQTPSDGVSCKCVPGPTLLPAYEPPRTSVVERDGVTMAVFDAPEGLTLYYTTDGRFPKLSDSRCTGPVEVRSETVFTVVGVDSFGTRTPAAVLEVRPNKMGQIGAQERG